MKLRDQWLYVLILLEFQSSIDRWMPLRMWVYLGLLYLELLEQQQWRNGKLPPVLPIVLYNGAPRWQASTQLADLLETLPGLRAYQPHFEFLLLDEGRYTEFVLVRRPPISLRSGWITFRTASDWSKSVIG